MNNEIEFVEETHTYLVNGIILPSVSEILEPISTSHYEGIDEYILKIACDRGSAIHKATENIDFNKEYEIEDKWNGYLEQYKNFKLEHNPTPILIEKQFTNGEYCGTIDRIYEINGIKYLTDIKTSAKINTTLVEPQLGGYSLLLKNNNIEFDKCAVLHLSKDKYEFRELEPNEFIFSCLLNIWKYEKGK